MSSRFLRQKCSDPQRWCWMSYGSKEVNSLGCRSSTSCGVKSLFLIWLHFLLQPFNPDWQIPVILPKCRKSLPQKFNLNVAVWPRSFFLQSAIGMANFLWNTPSDSKSYNSRPDPMASRSRFAEGRGEDGGEGEWIFVPSLLAISFRCFQYGQAYDLFFPYI